MQLSLCNLHLYLKTQNIYRNTVALPWWESEMLKEMPDKMPTPIEKKEQNLYEIFIRNIIKDSFPGKS